MLALDWIFGGVLLASLLLGAWRGLIYEVFSLVSWVVAFVLARWLAPDLAAHLPMSGSGETVRYAVAFAVVFVLSVLAGSLLAALVQKLFSAVGLRPADRALGAVFGLVRGVLLLLLATVVITMTPLKTDPWWQMSVSADLAQAALRGLKPVFPQEFVKYLPA